VKKWENCKIIISTEYIFGTYFFVFVLIDKEINKQRDRVGRKDKKICVTDLIALKKSTSGHPWRRA